MTDQIAGVENAESSKEEGNSCLFVINRLSRPTPSAFCNNMCDILLVLSYTELYANEP